MKTKTLTYNYDPDTRSLTILVDGKPKGGFIGPEGEKRFLSLLDTEAQINITAMTAEAFKKVLIRQFHAALANGGIMDHKESILAGYGVNSTTELTIDQLKEAIAIYSGRKPVKAVEVTPQVRAWRSELLTICNKMGVYVTNDDWSAVNHFFESPRVAGKRLNKLSLEELTALVPKMRAILAKHLKAQAEINRQKLQN